MLISAFCRHEQCGRRHPGTCVFVEGEGLEVEELRRGSSHGKCNPTLPHCPVVHHPSNSVSPSIFRPENITCIHLSIQFIKGGLSLVMGQVTTVYVY